MSMTDVPRSYVVGGSAASSSSPGQMGQTQAKSPTKTPSMEW